MCTAHDKMCLCDFCTKHIWWWLASVAAVSLLHVLDDAVQKVFSVCLKDDAHCSGVAITVNNLKSGMLTCLLAIAKNLLHYSFLELHLYEFNHIG